MNSSLLELCVTFLDWLGVIIAGFGIYRAAILRSYSPARIEKLRLSRLRFANPRRLSDRLSFGVFRLTMSIMVAVFPIVIIYYVAKMIRLSDFYPAIYFSLLNLLPFSAGLYWIKGAYTSFRTADRFTEQDLSDFRNQESTRKRLDNEAYFAAIVGVMFEATLKATHAVQSSGSEFWIQVFVSFSVAGAGAFVLWKETKRLRNQPTSENQSPDR